MRIESYRDLVTWQRAMDLVVTCYRMTDRFPPSERFGLTFQIRKSAVSIPSNTAEGYQRRSTGAYLHHLSIASGSQGELRTQIEIALRLGFITHTEAEPVLQSADEVGRLLYALAESVKAESVKTESLKEEQSAQRTHFLTVPET